MKFTQFIRRSTRGALASIRSAEIRPDRTYPSMRSTVRPTIPSSKYLLIGDRQKVDPRLDGQRHRLVIAVPLTDRAHLQVVADHDPVPSQPIAQDPGHHTRGQRGGPLRIERGIEDVGRQHGIDHAIGDHAPIRLELEVLPHIGDVYDAKVRVTGRAAVPREMLQGRAYSYLPMPGHERLGLGHDEVGIGAEAAIERADDRVGRRLRSTTGAKLRSIPASRSVPAWRLRSGS